MKKNSIKTSISVIATASLFTGCTHPLTVKNMDMYRHRSMGVPLEKPLRLGIQEKAYQTDAKRLARDFAADIGRYNVHATTAIYPDKSNVDVIATFDARSQYTGSAWNFLISWPGFVLWTPAWHGYKYNVVHDVTVNLADARTGELIKTVEIPMDLDIRHAAMKRTWVAESGWWLFPFYPVVSFVGAFFHIGYDNDVTLLLEEKITPQLTDYIAQTVTDELRDHPVANSVIPESTNSVEKKLQQLNDLKTQGLLSEEEYRTKRQELINAL